MKPLQANPRSAALAALAFLAMAALGWMLGAPPRSAAKPRDETTPPPTSRHRAIAADPRHQLAIVRKAENEKQRLRRTIALAGSLPPSSFAEWLNGGYFDFRDGFELTLFRRIIEERWKAEDPEGFAAWCFRDHIGFAASTKTSLPENDAMDILARWATEDPKRLNAWFDKHPKNNLKEAVVLRLTSTNPQTAARLLKEFSSTKSNFFYGGFMHTIRKLAETSPDSLESILPSLPSHARFHAKTMIAEQRLKSSFDDELRTLAKRPDGWRIFSKALGVGFNDDLNKQLATSIQNIPPQWGSLLYHKLQNTAIIESAPEAWLQTDLATAGLNRKQIEHLQVRALSAIANKNPQKALKLLDNYQLSEKARQNVLDQISRKNQ